MKQENYFYLNGQIYFVNSLLNLSDLIRYLNYDTELFVLEYNFKICYKKDWSKIYLKDYDRVEIVTIVGGG